MKQFHLWTKSEKKVVIAETLERALEILGLTETDIINCFFGEIEDFQYTKDKYCGAV